MKTLAKLFAVSLFLFAPRLLCAQSQELTISPADRAYHLSRLWSEMKYNFVNLDQIKFDADSLYRAFLDEALDATSDDDYLRMLTRFMAAFGDGHTEFYARAEQPIIGKKDYVPLGLVFYGEKLYITHVRQAPNLEKKWLGAEVLKIEGVSVERYLEDTIFPYISASTKQHRLMQAYPKIVYQDKNKPLCMEIRQRDGKIKTISVQRNGEATRKIDDKNWGLTTSTPNRAVEYYQFDGGFSYMMIRSFRERNIPEIAKHVSEINKSKGLIIDMRYNGGGSTDVAWYLQSLLTPVGVDTILNFAWQTRVNDGVKKANSNWKEEYKSYYNYTAVRSEEPYKVAISDTIERIKVPVVILIGRYTFSAAEDFLVNMYEVPGRPMFIGSETGGSTGSPLVIDGLPHGSIARICTRRVCYPYSRKPFVNKGVTPDLEVTETIDDYLRLCELKLPPLISPAQIDDAAMLERVNREQYEYYKMLLLHDVVVKAAAKELKKLVK